MTRLAVLTDAVYPWHKGGKETRQEQLLSRLASRGIQVDIYTMKWWDGPWMITRNGITYHAICPRIPLYRGARRSIRQAVIFSACSLSLLARRFDHLEVDAIPVLQLFPARVVASLRRRPLIATWHEFWGVEYWRDYLGGVKGHLAGLLESLAVGLADVTIAASNGTRERLLAAGRLEADRIVAIPNGFDAQRLAAVAPLAGEAAHELVVVGRLLSHKKVDVALRSLRLLRHDGHNVRMAVIGEGPELPPLRRLAAQLGLGAAVTFTGALADHDDVLAHMRSARVLVFPSVREGFGLVALEAMALGTPVVTSDHPDNQTKALITPGVDGEVCSAEPEAVAAAIRRVLAERDRLSAAAQHTAAGYSWNTVADSAVREVYRHQAAPSQVSPRHGGGRVLSGGPS